MRHSDPSRPFAVSAFRTPSGSAEADRAAEIEVRGLAKSFQPGRPVFAGIDLTVARGEAVALIGPNGAGKSTLLRCLLRLVEPDAGTVRMTGRQVGGLGRAELRRLRATCGFVFQKHNLVPRLTALGNVVHGALARGHGPRCWFSATAPGAIRTEALQCLARVGLEEFADRRADRLSGGQAQRVAVARALMQHPRIVLADEPAASLDPAAGEEVMALFAQLARESGLTVLFTSHDLAHALRYADRVVLLRAGRMELDAPAADLDVVRLRRYYDAAA